MTRCNSVQAGDWKEAIDLFTGSRGDWLRRVIRDYMLAHSSTNSMPFSKFSIVRFRAGPSSSVRRRENSALETFDVFLALLKGSGRTPSLLQNRPNSVFCISHSAMWASDSDDKCKAVCRDLPTTGLSANFSPLTARIGTHEDSPLSDHCTDGGCFRGARCPC